MLPLIKPLSGREIYHALYGNTKIYVLDQLKKYKNVDDLFGDKDNCVILIPYKSNNIGHWVCLIKRDNDVIEFFDSYGNKPIYESRKIILDYLMKSPYEIRYNHHKLQKFGSTCGRWVILRILFSDKNEDEFKNLNLNDFDVSDITNYLYNI